MPHAVFYGYSVPDVFQQRMQQAIANQPIKPNKPKEDCPPAKSNPKCGANDKEKSSEA